MECSLCSKKFTTKQGLKYHVERNVCTKIDKKTCHMCGKKFSHYKALIII